MKHFVLLTLILTGPFANANYEGSIASEVWDVVTDSAYTTLPQEKVNMARLTRWGVNALSESANRTIDDKSDILPYFEKLVHPNGICLLGTWKISEENPYSGLYRKGTKAVIISRASVALSDTERGEYRGFGLTGKIYPTSNFMHTKKLKTANFFTIDDLGGTKEPKFMGAKLTNEPKVSVRLGSVFIADVAAFVAGVFVVTDKNPGIRQLYQISEMNEEVEDVHTPKWMRLSGAEGFDFSEAVDFRDEIIENINEKGKIVFNIEVAGEAKNTSFFQKQKFFPVGTITYTQAFAGENCDHRLHFNHPKFKSDIK